MVETPLAEELTPVRVRIRGFQSLEDVEIEVHGFTCITGPTNIGKSAIIRAISGALMNSPVTGAVRKGKKFCSVEIKAEKWGFKWEKAEKGVNRYWIPADADKPLAKVGQGQIEPVADMGFQSVKVGKDYIQPWLATQFNPIFLMNKSGPAITDFISEVSRLRVLQDAIIINARGKKRSLDKAKIREEDIEVLRKKEEAVAPLDNLLKVEQDLEAQAESLEEWTEQIEVGQRLSDQMEATAEGIRILLKSKEVKVPLDRTAKQIERLGDMYLHWTRLEEAAVRVHDLREIEQVEIPDGPTPEDMARMALLRRFSGLPELLWTVELLEAVELIPAPEGPEEGEVSRLVKGAALVGRIIEAEAAVEALSEQSPKVPEDVGWPSRLSKGASMLEELEQLEQEEKKFELRLKTTREELAEVEAELASIPVCPTCERPVDPALHSHA
jgi:energy-coupling factor transporter ATP-binding protein EcfA2